MSPSPETSITSQRSVRDMLMTYGANNGKRLTDEELANLLLQEILTLSEDAREIISSGMFTARVYGLGYVRATPTS